MAGRLVWPARRLIHLFKTTAVILIDWTAGDFLNMEAARLEMAPVTAKGSETTPIESQ